MKKKTIVTGILTIITCLSLIAGATFALFTSESKVNIAVTSGKVDVKASIGNVQIYSAIPQTNYESQEKEDGVEYTDENGAKYYSIGPLGETWSNGGTAKIENNELKLTSITPGDKVKFEINYTNNSDVNIMYRVVVEATDGDELFKYLEISVFGKKLYGVKRYSDWQQVSANGTIESTGVEILLPMETPNVQNEMTNMYISVEAVQGNASVDNCLGEHKYVLNQTTGKVTCSACDAEFTKDTYFAIFGESNTVECIYEIDATNPVSQRAFGIYGVAVENGNVTYDSTDALYGKTVAFRLNGGDLTLNAPKDTVYMFGTANVIYANAVADHSLYVNCQGERVQIHDGNLVVTKNTDIKFIYITKIEEEEKFEDVKITVEAGANLPMIYRTPVVIPTEGVKVCTVETIFNETENLNKVEDIFLTKKGIIEQVEIRNTTGSQEVRFVINKEGDTVVKSNDVQSQVAEMIANELSGLSRNENKVIEEKTVTTTVQVNETTMSTDTTLRFNYETRDFEIDTSSSNVGGQALTENQKQEIIAKQDELIENTVSVDESGKMQQEVEVITTCEHEFTYTDYDHDGADVCLGTCTKCGLQERFVHDWVVGSHLPGQTSYTGICSRCGCIRLASVALVVDEQGNPVNIEYAPIKDKPEDKITPTNGKYSTLPAAFDAVHNGSVKKVTIKLLNDEKYDVSNSAMTVKAGEDITLELNGLVLEGYNSTGTGSALISVERTGKLTIKDSSDIQKDGTGTGLIKFTSVQPDNNPVPGYASNCIMIYGVVNFESGKVENDTMGAASYVFDLMYGATLNMTGGFAEAKSNAIRQWANGGNGNTVIITDGIIKSTQAAALWVQDSQLGSGSTTISNAIIDGGLNFGYSGDTRDYVITITNCDIIGNVLFNYKYNTVAKLTNNRITGNILESESGCCDYENNTYNGHFIGFYSVYVIANEIGKGEGYFTSSQPAGTDFTVTRDWITEEMQIYVANNYWSKLSSAKSNGYLLDESSYSVEGNTLTILWSGVNQDYYDSFLTIYILPPVDYVKVGDEYVKANYKVEYVSVDSGLFDCAESLEKAQSLKEEYETEYTEYTWSYEEKDIYVVRWANNPDDDNPDWKISSYHFTESEANTAKEEFEANYGKSYGANVIFDETLKYAINYYGEFNETAYFYTEEEAINFAKEHNGTVSENN